MIKTFTAPMEQNKEEKKEYRWQVAISLLILFVLGSIANIPFSLELRRLKLMPGEIDSLLSEPIINYVLQICISSAILGAILIFIGLWVSSRVNLGAPVLARMFSKKPINELINWKSFLSSVILAMVVAIILLVLFEFQKEFYPVATKIERPSKSFYFLVSFSAGISEEIMFRLGLMSLIITVIQFLKKANNPSNKIIWIGILSTALIFGIMHFPITSNFFELTPFTIGVTMIGNLITGTTFGWIFWRRGLLIAIASHIVFDIVFHVIGSPFG